MSCKEICWETVSIRIVLVKSIVGNDKFSLTTVFCRTRERKGDLAHNPIDHSNGGLSNNEINEFYDYFVHFHEFAIVIGGKKGHWNVQLAG